MHSADHFPLHFPFIFIQICNHNLNKQVAKPSPSFSPSAHCLSVYFFVFCQTGNLGDTTNWVRDRRTTQRYDKLANRTHQKVHMGYVSMCMHVCVCVRLYLADTQMEPKWVQGPNVLCKLQIKSGHRMCWNRQWSIVLTLSLSQRTLWLRYCQTRRHLTQQWRR